MKAIRAFVAIHLPAAVKRSLAELSHELAVQMPPQAVRWVKPEHIHLTLRFLGDTASDKLPLLAAGLDQIGMKHDVFDLCFSEFGCFPNLRRPRVLWVGAKGEVDRLQSLKTDIDEMLAALGWPVEDRPFKAHLTLGRVKDSRSLRGAIWTVEVEPLVLTVSAIHLVESQLRPSGPVYMVRHSSDFA